MGGDSKERHTGLLTLDDGGGKKILHFPMKALPSSENLFVAVSEPPVPELLSEERSLRIASRRVAGMAALSPSVCNCESKSIS